MSGKYANTFYRTSLKAIIRNDKGEVLLAKEQSSAWSLPGGGMDHGKLPYEALKRELYEEVQITSPFTAQLVYAHPFYKEEKEAWGLWLVYKVEVENLKYGIGKDASAVAFIDPSIFKDSLHRSEQLVYKFTVDT